MLGFNIARFQTNVNTTWNIIEDYSYPGFGLYSVILL